MLKTTNISVAFIIALIFGAKVLDANSIAINRQNWPSVSNRPVKQGDILIGGLFHVFSTVSVNATAKSTTYRKEPSLKGALELAAFIMAIDEV
jgi:hypothetical protein